MNQVLVDTFPAPIPILENKEKNVNIPTSKTVKDELSSQISVIGENLTIRRFEKVESPNGLVYDYVHAGGKIGVLVSIESNVVNDQVKNFVIKEKNFI